MASESVAAAIAARRSVRKFRHEPVDPTTVRELVAIACTAPAPHHTRPWRFVEVTTDAARERLADAMSDAWMQDLDAAGESVHRVAKLLGRSRAQIMDAPVLLLACLELSGAHEWPDERRAAERDMFVQSLGAALQNLLLALGERQLAGYLKGAPLFCADAVRSALDLPDGWEPTFLVLFGYPDDATPPPPRPAADPDDFLIER